MDEPVSGDPKRPIPRDENAAKALKKRTLTDLYNARPQCLADAHDALDAAVAAAYGWPADVFDDDILRELLRGLHRVGALRVSPRLPGLPEVVRHAAHESGREDLPMADAQSHQQVGLEPKCHPIRELDVDPDARP